MAHRSRTTEQQTANKTNQSDKQDNFFSHADTFAFSR
jgi:hypothetical protein